MIQKSFIPNKTALITLIAACLVVIISLGIRQTFGLFFFDFEIDLGCTQTEFVPSYIGVILLSLNNCSIP